MRKLVFLLLFLFLFLSPKNFLVNNIAEAATWAPDSLTTTTSCEPDSTGKNTVSTITFHWYGYSSTNQTWYFWKTGDTSETNVDYGGWANLVQKDLPYNTKYDWYVKARDTGTCIIDCIKTTNGPTVTSPDCSAAKTCTPTDSCSSKNWSCGSFTNSCGVSIDCGDCGSNPYEYCDDTHKCAQTVTNNNNCANRDRQCTDLTQYPQSKCTDFSSAVQWGCPAFPNGCPMTNSSVSPTTHSCAFSKDYVPDTNVPVNGTCYPLLGVGGAQGNCKDGLFCDRTGASALDPGTCKEAPTDWGAQCNTCFSTDHWVGTDTSGSCVNASGQDTTPASHAYCNINGANNETCKQGAGCQTKFPTNVDSPLDVAGPPLSCAALSADGKTCASINTGLGFAISTDVASFTRSLVGIVLSIAGGIAILLIIISGYRIMVSQGNPENIKNAREQLTAAIVGLLFVIFSLVILQVIGVNILGLPGFSP